MVVCFSPTMFSFMDTAIEQAELALISAVLLSEYDKTQEGQGSQESVQEKPLTTEFKLGREGGQETRGKGQ